MKTWRKEYGKPRIISTSIDKKKRERNKKRGKWTSEGGNNVSVQLRRRKEGSY